MEGVLEDGRYNESGSVQTALSQCDPHCRSASVNQHQLDTLSLIWFS
jgi:hypothetical protein